jgi:hypothetical protein
LHVDTSRLVCHKDILPTIYNLTLSDYEYWATGDNIFDATTADSAFVVTRTQWVMGKDGCIDLSAKQSYIWKDEHYLQPHGKTPELEALRRKANAWLFGMKWQIYNDIKKQSNR